MSHPNPHAGRWIVSVTEPSGRRQRYDFPHLTDRPPERFHAFLRAVDFARRMLQESPDWTLTGLTAERWSRTLERYVPVQEE
jgi:hypothetical protein